MTVAERTIAAGSDQQLKHDPDEVLDYEINWATQLNETEHISASTFHDQHGNLTFGLLVMSQKSFSNTATKFWLSGGNLGQVYPITNHITTDEGREMDTTFKVEIESK